MSLTEPAALIIIIGSFIASAISSAFAIGGGFLMLAIISTVMPIHAMVPMHSASMLGISVGRSWFFRKHVVWSITIPFIFGALIGAALGTRIYVDLPEVLIATVVALLILAAVWFPTIDWRPKIPHPFFYVGVIHAFLSSMFSFGGLFQPLVMRTKLLKMQIVGTLAVSLLVMNIFKLSGYAAFGFEFKPYLSVIFVAILAGIPGTILGKRLIHYISEEQFRLVFRIIMTIFAARLLYRAWLLI